MPPRRTGTHRCLPRSGQRRRPSLPPPHVHQCPRRWVALYFWEKGRMVRLPNDTTAMEHYCIPSLSRMVVVGHFYFASAGPSAPSAFSMYRSLGRSDVWVDLLPGDTLQERFTPPIIHLECALTISKVPIRVAPHQRVLLFLIMMMSNRPASLYARRCIAIIATSDDAWKPKKVGKHSKVPLNFETRQQLKLGVKKNSTLVANQNSILKR